MEVSYLVTCSCGQVLSGRRQTSYQVVRCPRCGSDRFILPRSPFLQAAGKSLSAQPPSRTRPSFRLWLAPAVATIVTAAGFLLVYLLFLKPETSPKREFPETESRSAKERLVLAEKYLGE